MKKLTSLAVLLLGLAPMLTFGAAPSGTYNYEITDLPIYDFYGEYNVTVPVTGGDLNLVFSLNHGPDGKADGSGTFTVASATVNGSGTVSVKGSADDSSKGRNRGRGEGSGSDSDAPSLNLSFKLRGDGPPKITGNFKVTLVLDTTTGQLTGTPKGKINSRGSRGVKLIGPMSLTLDPANTGAFNLTINITETSGNTLTGTGAFTTVGGREITFDLIGRHNPTTDETLFTLQGADEGDDENSRNSSNDRIRLLTLGEFAELQAIEVRLFGQSQSFGDLDNGSSDDGDDEDEDEERIQKPNKRRGPK